MRTVGEASLGGAVMGVAEDGVAFLEVSVCPSCGDMRFPARPLCPNDLHRTHVARSAEEGIIYEAVKMSLVPPGFEAPIWVGYVDLPGSIRVFSQLGWREGEPEPRHGDAVTLTMQVVSSDGEDVLGPVFERRSTHARGEA